MTRILVTGAAGRIGRTLRHGLTSAGYTFNSVDTRPVEDQLPDEQVFTGDISDAGLLDDAMRGVAAVVHLAAIPTEAPWEEIRAANIDGTWSVFDAARRAGVPRVVFASSVHASGFSRRTDLLRVDEPAKPDGLYGVSKVFGEALGRMYADRYGMQIACIRIGAFEDQPRNNHHRPVWLSPTDAVRLFHACLTSPDLGFAILYGVSANGQGWLDLTPARKLGYEPQDDAERYADSISAEGIADPLGGPLTEPSADADAVAARWADRRR